MQKINKYFRIEDSDKIEIYVHENGIPQFKLITNDDNFENYVGSGTPLIIQISRDSIIDVNPGQRGRGRKKIIKKNLQVKEVRQEKKRYDRGKRFTNSRKNMYQL